MDRTSLGVTVAAILMFCGYLLSSLMDESPRHAPEASILLSQTATVSGDESSPAATHTSRPPAEEFVPKPKIGTSSVQVVESIRSPEPTPASPLHPAVSTSLLARARVESRLRHPRRHPAYREIEALVTAYCPCRRCCGRHANGRTSTGTSAWNRGAATDPRAIPYGTRIYVQGYGFTTVDDTGGAMRHRRRRGLSPQIDVRMDYHWQARRWGRRYMRVRIYDR